MNPRSPPTQRSPYRDKKPTDQPAMKGLQFFTLLFKLADNYITAFESGNKEELGRRDERLVRVQKINQFIEQIELNCHLEEGDKLDCLV